MEFIKSVIFAGLAVLLFVYSGYSQATGGITGQVQDGFNAAIVGATVTVVSSTGVEKTTTSNERGEFTVSGLAPGKYTVRVVATSFSLYENTDVNVVTGRRVELTVPMTVEAVEEQVDVQTDDTVSTDPQSTASATVLKEKDLETLPDDPDELEAALQALAGPSAGPNGGQIYIDGFTGGRLPPKEAIREIRLNSNPFSAEYDRLGFGRIEILTRPGSERFRGSLFTNFNDESLNSRNPFASNRAPSQTRFFGGNISGPIQKGKSSFFVDINNRDNDSNSVVNARLLDSNLNVIPFTQDVRIPSRRFSISPRFDYAINENNTLIARYSFSRNSTENQGIGNFSLPSRAYETTNTDHEIRLTETMIINATTINETRFEYDWEDREQTGDNSIPTINVADAFTGGGSQIGLSFNKERSWELQNFTTMALGKGGQHAVKFGFRARGLTISDRSENNFGGSFTFTNLDNYRNAILGTAIPTQFTITTGDPEEKVSRTDYGLFITDDWRVRPDLTLSFGLRYENQTNLSDNLNFAPRFSFAWSPGAGGNNQAKTVFRGGFGIFYDRISENLTLQAQRFNGTSQLNLVVNSQDSDPIRRAAAQALLEQAVFTVDGVTNAPTVAQILAALPQSNTIRTISPVLQAPYVMQTALGVERQLPNRATLSVFYIASRTLHAMRMRNINAPICPEQIDCLNAPRPDPAAGNIYQYESSGFQNQQQMIVNVRAPITRRINLWGNYRLGFAKGDTDGGFGGGGFPAYSYDLSGEYGRTSFDSRHSFHFGGSITLPWEISISPMVNAFTGRPFNITRGVDLNGDALFTERPTFGDLGERCNALGITASYCDVAGEDPNAIIPRNYGQGPSFFSFNMRIGKNFGFGGSGDSAQPSGGNTGGGPAGGGFPGAGRRGPMGGGRMGGFGGGGDGRKPYNLNIGLFINNVFNNVNYNSPVGNLSSSRFGQSTSTAGSFGPFGGSGSANRRVELQARFSW